jgi:hypothetical protein
VRISQGAAQLVLKGEPARVAAGSIEVPLDSSGGDAPAPGAAACGRRAHNPCLVVLADPADTSRRCQRKSC